MCICVCGGGSRSDVSNSSQPMDYSLQGTSVHGILQARILEWAAISFSKGSSQPRDQTRVYLHCRQILYHLSHPYSTYNLKLR